MCSTSLHLSPKTHTKSKRSCKTDSRNARACTQRRTCAHTHAHTKCKTFPTLPRRKPYHFSRTRSIPGKHTETNARTHTGTHTNIFLHHLAEKIPRIHKETHARFANPLLNHLTKENHRQHKNHIAYRSRQASPIQARDFLHSVRNLQLWTDSNRTHAHQFILVHASSD